MILLVFTARSTGNARSVMRGGGGGGIGIIVIVILAIVAARGGIVGTTAGG